MIPIIDSIILCDLASRGLCRFSRSERRPHICTMPTFCKNIVKSTGLPCCRLVINFTPHCGYHAPKKQRVRRAPRMLEECAICYNAMMHSQPRQACGHRFHDRCISRWLKTGRNTCPLCRTVLDEDAISDHDDDPSYMPPVAVVHGGARGSLGSTANNPIVIDTNSEGVQVSPVPIYTPTTPSINHPRYIPSSPQFHFPVARQLVFESP